MTSDVEDIYSRFYLKVEDYKIAGLDQDIANEILKGYLQSTISKPFTRRLFSSISYDFDVGEIEYTMVDSLDQSSDIDFVEEMLALGMVCQWMSSQYHSFKNTQQFFSNKEQQLSLKSITSKHSSLHWETL